MIALLVSCKSKQKNVSSSEVITETKSRYEKIDLKSVNNQIQLKASDLGSRLLETCNTSKFKVFTKNEATDKVIQNATVEKVTKTCQKILVRNGKFKGLNLIDVTQDNETDELIFRYKIDYEKTYFERELYVTMNSEGKVSALKTKELPKKPM